MLAIRFAPMGTKKKRMFRITISEKSRDVFGRVLEILGSYNPHTKVVQAKAERINYWLSKGAAMSSSVNNVLVKNKIVTGNLIKGPKVAKKEAKTEAKPVETAKTVEVEPAVQS
jgi:small subunit ribosomal protein S16